MVKGVVGGGGVKNIKKLLLINQKGVLSIFVIVLPRYYGYVYILFVCKH